MDIQLPVMDGIEATKEIRKLERNNNIGVFPSTPISELPRMSSAVDVAPSSPFRSSVIIVALTASSMQTDRVAALAAGCNDFLTKPVSLRWLEKKIVEWGCMQVSCCSEVRSLQALIDFEGWRRWKTSDKDPGETKRGFQVGPQAAARNLASRLRIERKPSRNAVPTSESVPVATSNSANDVTSATNASRPVIASTAVTGHGGLDGEGKVLEPSQTSAVGTVPDDIVLPGPASGLGDGASPQLRSLGSGEGRGAFGSNTTLSSIHEDAESPAVPTKGLDKPLPNLPKE
jgi:CheY-like chemotaxis protein